MILAHGKIYGYGEQDEILSRLPQDLNDTLRTKTLSAQTVIDAIDKLSAAVKNGEFDERLSSIAMDGIERYRDMAITLLGREYISEKIRVELGEGYFERKHTKNVGGVHGIFSQAMPLGVILHIAAGNVDGLPAFSVAEGLLTGNINILKLPRADNGLTLEIIARILEIAPELCDFIYVFDTPSTDVGTILKLAELSDGISVWGGDAAVAAVRQFAPATVKIIEWGHKLGFAYISGYEDKERELQGLAEHIMSTKQLLCSSCQTIYVDTDSMDEVYSFCREFLPYLEYAAQKYPPESVGAVAENTLRRYSDSLEKIICGDVGDTNGVFVGEGCSLTARKDSELELSYMFGNCLVKPLPSDRLFCVLREKKGYLQTAGLICEESKRAQLTDLLMRAGVLRIMRAGDMSELFCGEAHDGEYPLLRYTRIVNIQD